MKIFVATSRFRKIVNRISSKWRVTLTKSLFPRRLQDIRASNRRNILSVEMDRMNRSTRFYIWIIDNYKSMNVPVHGFCNDDSITGLWLNPSKARTRQKNSITITLREPDSPGYLVGLVHKKQCLRFDTHTVRRRSKNRPWKSWKFFRRPYVSPNFSILYEMENVVLFEKILAWRSMFIFTWIHRQKWPYGMLKNKKENTKEEDRKKQKENNRICPRELLA